MSVEFAPWPTPIADADVDLVEVRYLDGEFDIAFPEKGRRYRAPSSTAGLPPEFALIARFFANEHGCIYRIGFPRVRGFRVLDENGLDELWRASSTSKRPALTTFRVRGHGWARESPATFGAHGGWSYMVATGWDCLEVVCDIEPVVERMEDVGYTPVADG